MRATPTSLAYDDFTEDAKRTYYYWVKACNDDSVCSDYSAYDSGWREMATVTNVAASDGTYTDKVQVSWSSVSDASYYEVYRALSQGGAKSLLGNPTASPYNDSGAAENIVYHYWVVACNANGCSGYSSDNTGYLGQGLIQIFLPLIVR